MHLRREPSHPALVARGVKAGAVVKAAAALVGGGGGGRDTLAQAGGRDPERLDGGAGTRARGRSRPRSPGDARARARLRQRALRVRAERPERAPSRRPLETVARPGDARPASRRSPSLVGERGAERVVVGLPLALRGGDTAQTRETRAFAGRLQRVLGERVPVELYDERFTTRIAQRLPAGGAGARLGRGLARRRASARELAAGAGAS